MMMHALDEVGRVSNVELVGRLERLVKADQALRAKLLVHLGEVEARELHRDRGFSSMFEYCNSGLGMSEGETYLRLLAARVGRRFPLVLERLGAGAVNLSAIKLLAPHLTAENHVQLLDRVRGMSKHTIKVLLADLAPKPDVPARVRRLPERRNAAASRCAAPAPAESNTTASSAAAGSTSPATAEPTATNVAVGSSTPTFAEPSSNTTNGATGRTALRFVESNSVRSNDAGGTSALMPAEPTTVRSSAATGSIAPTAAESHLAVHGAALGSTACTSATSAVSAPPSAALDGLATARPTAASSAVRASSPELALESPRARATCTPLGRGRFNVVLTLGQEAYDALEQLVELLRHQNPSGDMTNVVERALSELLKSTMKRRFGQINAPRPQAAHKPAAKPDAEVTTKSPDVERKDTSKPSSVKSSRYIPRGVLREVHARDMGQCTYVSSDGRRCTARGFLEVHHHNTTFARGGEATAENLRLVCRLCRTRHKRHYAAFGFMPHTPRVLCGLPAILGCRAAWSRTYAA